MESKIQLSSLKLQTEISLEVSQHLKSKKVTNNLLAQFLLFSLLIHQIQLNTSISIMKKNILMLRVLNGMNTFLCLEILKSDGGLDKNRFTVILLFKMDSLKQKEKMFLLF